MSTSVKWGFAMYDGRPLGWYLSSESTDDKARQYVTFDYDTEAQCISAMDDAIQSYDTQE